LNEAEIQNYKLRVLNILRIFFDKYGLKADLVNINRQTIDTAVYKVMKIILEDQNITIEIDDRVAVGKFMFVNRELAASNNL